MKRLAAALLIVLALASCGRDPLEGEVTKKDYRAPYDTTVMVPQYTTSCSGNPQVCTQRLAYYLPVQQHHPACYRVYVRTDTGDGGSHIEDGCINEGDWNGLKVGDYYTEKDS